MSEWEPWVRIARVTRKHQIMMMMAPSTLTLRMRATVRVTLAISSFYAGKQRQLLHNLMTRLLLLTTKLLILEKKPALKGIVLKKVMRKP